MIKKIKTSVREHLEQIEENTLSQYAAFSSRSKGRMEKDDVCEIRPIFQHDRDRIVHSKAFRRLEDKTQVFLSPTGSHYRNRLTHTLEVSQIARTITKALSLNDSLTEAIAMGHDLGHTPFGHTGERALRKILKDGFFHEKQSLRVVDKLAKSGKGLNLSFEVRNGIVSHSKGRGPLHKADGLPLTLEGQIVRLSDIIAYINHDIDDAIGGGFLKKEMIPYRKETGESGSERVNSMVSDIIKSSYEMIEAGEPLISLSPIFTEIVVDLREFLYENIYLSKKVNSEFAKAERVILSLFEYFSKNYDQLTTYYRPLISDNPLRNIADFIASLTDSYAISLYEKLFVPVRMKYPEYYNEV